MSHILIQNKGELPISGLRLLGLSNKTEEQIGQFGTGLKESLALLARLESLPIIYSGTCRMEFSVQELDGHQEICFRLSEQRERFSPDEWHGLGMHPNFGKADWDDAWMVLREIMCNALDESGQEDLFHDIVSGEPEGVEGATRVYIPNTQPLMKAYTTVHDRILLLGNFDTLVDHPSEGRIIAKREQKAAQIFHRGVWVQENKEHESIYDYDLTQLKLSESRHADWNSVEFRIGDLFQYFTVEMATEVLKTVLKDKKEVYELEVFSRATYFMSVTIGENWMLAFENLFGENAVMTDNEKFFYDRLDQRGSRPIVVEHSSLREFLKKCGVKDALDVLTDDQKQYLKLENPSPAQQEVFDSVWDKFVAAGIHHGKEKPGLMVFKQRPGESTVVFGRYRNGVCHINMDCSGSTQERVACIEEIAHHVSEARDHSQEFQTYLVEIVQMLMFNDVLDNHKGS